MRRSLLTAPTTRLTKAAEQLVGVQAQVMSSAELALAIRSKSTSAIKVQDALWNKRSLVKTWAQRGTLHLVTPADLPVFVAAMTMRGEYWAKPPWEKFHGIKAPDMRLMLDAIEDALGDDALTRTELAAHLAKVTKGRLAADKIAGSWGSALKPAAFAGKLCFGPNRGRNVTFVTPRSWLGDLPVIDGDEALAALALRYLDTYGPTTQADLTRWLGVEPKVGRHAWKLVQEDLVFVDVDGTEMALTQWGAEDINKVRPTGALRLLPAFDPYVVGVLKDLERLLPKASLRPKVSRTAGWISATVVQDGAIVGTWTHKRTPKGVDITTELFRKLSANERSQLRSETASMSSLMTTVPEEDR